MSKDRRQDNNEIKVTRRHVSVEGENAAHGGETAVKQGMSKPVKVLLIVLQLPACRGDQSGHLSRVICK